MPSFKEFATNFAIVTTSLIVSLMVGELALGLLKGPNKDTKINTFVKLAEESGMEFDSRTRLQVVDHLRKEGVDAFPHGNVASLNEILDSPEYFVLSNVANATIVHCNESGTWAIYQSDEFGFNNPKGTLHSSPQVTLVGDSFTQGACVAEEHSIAGRLREKGLKVLNLGHGGNGPLANLAVIREYASIARSKTVIWFHYEGNDLQDLQRELRTPALKKYLHPNFHQLLADSSTELDELKKKSYSAEIDRQLLLSRVSLKSVASLSSIRALVKEKLLPAEPTGSFPRRRDKNLNMTIAAAKKAVESWGGQLIFVYLPSWNRYAKDVKEGTHFLSEKASLRKQVKKVAKRFGLTVLDMTRIFSKKTDDRLDLFPFRWHGHYTPTGYEHVSDAVSEYLP